MLVLQLVDLNAYDAVASSNGLLDFVVDVLAICRLVANEHDRDCGALKSIINHLLDFGVTLLLRLLPQRSITESRSSAPDNLVQVADLVYAPNITLVVKAEEHASH
ncbi:hypothetical protein D3C81_1437780 [compost metagenome]